MYIYKFKTVTSPDIALMVIFFQMECGTRHPTMIKDTITEECPQDIHMDITRECPVSDMPVLDTLLLLDPAGPV